MDEAGTKENEENDQGEPSTESLLEALLVDDAEVVWDPATGRPKIVLDRQPESD
jgi:hypothetical protein